MTTQPFKPMSLAELQLSAWPERMRDHISASSVKTFARCPEQFRRHYILGQSAPPNANMLWGSADHAAIEQNFKQKIDSYEDEPVQYVRERFAVALDARVDDAGGASQVDWGNTDEDPDGEVVKGDAGARRAWAEVKDRGVELVSAYHKDSCPRIQPSAVEEEFEVFVPGFPVKIVGVIDTVAELVEPGFNLYQKGAKRFEQIVERKTTGRNQVAGEWRVQGSIYQLHTPLPVGFHLSLKQKTPRTVIPASDDDAKLVLPMQAPARTIAALKRTMIGIASAYSLYGPDEPWPNALTHPWACGYCGFRGNCPWWRDDLWTAAA